MKIKKNHTVLLTGASGGLGRVFAREFAKREVNLALVAYPGNELESLRKQLEREGVKALCMSADVSDSEQRKTIIAKTEEEFGQVDILVNNAGVEYTSPLPNLTEKELIQVLRVNLEAPMALSRLVMPGMLERKTGHILNISSLAGKSGPALQEPYAASKAGLVGFTTSLRASLHNTGVSASVICPGFVEAGIYERLKNATGQQAPALLGTVSPDKVIGMSLRAIEDDSPVVVINQFPVWPLFALSEISPRCGAWIIRKIGAHDFFNRVFEAKKKS